MEPTLPQQSWQVFVAIFAFSVVFNVWVHFFIVALSSWKSFIKI